MTTHDIGTLGETCRFLESLRIAEMPVLDLGCGDAPCTHQMEGVVLIDLITRPTNPPGVIVADIRSVCEILRRDYFGTVYLLDVIEHLHKEEGLKLLTDLEQVGKRIVVFTPIGELWMGLNHADPEHPYAHKSGWLPEEMRKLNFQTWEWPEFHKFPDDAEPKTCGAFFAWKDTP